jgi:hypothetical protein
MTTLTQVTALMVTWQDPRTRWFHKVGTLSWTGTEYLFAYAHDPVHEIPGLAPGRDHRSETLFPVFATRLMAFSRADRAAALQWIGLTPDSSPLEVLAVSGGTRAGDTYELIPIPQPGPICLHVLVHGIRHTTPEARRHIDGLVCGATLELIEDVANPVNTRALVVSDSGHHLGWIPDPLLETVHALDAGTRRVSVAQVNPSSAGFALRLLIQLEGVLG